MSTDAHEDAALALEHAAEVLDRAARHLRVAARHARGQDRPRMVARVLAAQGHLHVAGQTLAGQAVAHASRSRAE